MPIFTASTPMSPATARTSATILGARADLGDDHPRRHLLDRLDPDRVLRGQRRDRRHPVDAATRERLQVGLDPRAAARARAGDREHRGYRFLSHHWSLDEQPEKAASPVD